MAKQKKETYQDYINEGGHGLSGLKWKDTNEPIETIGSLGSIKLSQQTQGKSESTSPWTENVSDIYGQTDFGESTYDEKIQNATELTDIEGARANAQPFIDKVGAGLGTFAAKTVTATAGGLGSLFYGVPKAIIDGEFNHIYNNDFNK